MSDRGNKVLRVADRYIGIPIVAILGLFKGRCKKPETFKTVGILATAAIGDTLLISPVVKDFKSRYPDADITIFCGKTNRQTFEMTLPDYKLITIPVNNPFKSISLLREHKFDLFFDFGPWPRLNSILTAFSKSKFKVGFKSLNQHRHMVYNSVIPHLNTNHELDNLRRLVSGFNVKSQSVPFLGEAKPDKLDPYVIIHMFPSGYLAHYKEWSDKNWVILINGLTSSGVKVKLTGAPVDVEACNRVVSKCDSQDQIEVLAGKTNLLQVGEVLQKAILVISVNTGIMHMAAAYNQSVIALHGPTSPLRWGPVCDSKTDFCGTTIGSGCLHLGFEYVTSDKNSLDSINPVEVKDKALEIYSKINNKF